MNDLDKIEKIFRMIGSENDHEILIAVKSIKKILALDSKNFSDLSNHLFQTPTLRETAYNAAYQQHQRYQEYKNENKSENYNMASYLHSIFHTLSEWEQEFISSLYPKLRRGSTCSVKQEECLRKIYNKKTGS